MRMGCLIFPRGDSFPCMLCTRLAGGGATRLLEVLAQGLLPLSWGCGREARHSGVAPNLLHMSLLGRRVVGNLRLSGTFWAPTDTASGSGPASPSKGPWELVLSVQR